jgi:nitrosocyanin
VAVIATIGAVGLAGCSGNHKTENFRIDATSVNGQSAFSIGTITVTQGDKVNIEVGNTTDKAHGFSIDEFNIHRVVEPHKTQTVSFTPGKTGQFKVYCQLHPAHVPSSMIVVG